MRLLVDVQKQELFAETAILILVRLKDGKAKIVGIGGR
jgi:hypothetical protein